MAQLVAPYKCFPTKILYIFFPVRIAFLLVLPHRPLVTYALEVSIYLVYPCCRYI